LKAVKKATSAKPTKKGKAAKITPTKSWSKKGAPAKVSKRGQVKKSRIDVSGYEDLSNREFDCLDVVVQFIADNGYSPTVREVAEDLGVSVQPAHRLLGLLRDKGIIEWNSSLSRTIRLT